MRNDGGVGVIGVIWGGSDRVGRFNNDRVSYFTGEFGLYVDDNRRRRRRRRRRWYQTRILSP